MADLTVRGAGIFGLSIAWTALQRGARVTVVDPYGPGAGSSGGIVGALQPHTPDPWNDKKQFQLESLLMAKGFWAGVEAQSGVSSGYSQVGRLMPLKTDREVALAHSRKDAARERWGSDLTWEVVDAPDAPPSPTGLYVHDTLSAILNPRCAVESLANAVQSKGGKIALEAPEFAAEIWATGWLGLQDLGQSFARPIGNGVKGQAALFDFNAAGHPQIYAEGLHLIPHLDGTFAVGSTSERDFDTPDTTDAQLDDIIARARHLVPALQDAQVLTKWAGVRPRAQSRAPLLGPWPDRPGHFIANGGFKIGFGMAPKVAEVMVDLVLEGRDNIPPDFHTDAM
jgi:glycine/D-amino acid oxidase-like deaminating enzyme